MAFSGVMHSLRLCYNCYVEIKNSSHRISTKLLVADRSTRSPAEADRNSFQNCNVF
jgi:hypothetical protein